MREKQIVVANQLVNYYTNENDSAGKTVVFLHGWRSEGAVWKKVIDRMNTSRVFALDLPGFGKSEPPKKAFVLDDYAAVVLAFLQKLQLNSVVLVGHSFGGRIAIKLAAVEREYVGKLILVDSAGFRLYKGRNTVLRVLAKVFKPFFLIPGTNSLKLRIYRALGAEDYLATPELRDTFLSVINEDLSALLRYITQKTLIIWGGKDTDTPMVMALWLRENIRHSDLLVLDNAGHFSFLDEPEKFVQAVNNFIGQ